MQPTAPQRLAALTVIHSLMPKGVEHCMEWCYTIASGK